VVEVFYEKGGPTALKKLSGLNYEPYEFLYHASEKFDMERDKLFEKINKRLNQAE
jgi:hypothetical protein